jgi:hypothetical protein
MGMAQSAQVTSIDAVQRMAAAVDAFRCDAASALDDLEMEIRRALEWIQHDRREHWTHEVRRGWERVAEARVQLQQAVTFRRIGNHDPSCIDEKKAVEQTKRRLEIAQQKIEAVRHWSHAIQRAVDEYRASRGQLTGWLDADFPRAIAALKRMTAALERYVAMDLSGEAATQSTIPPSHAAAVAAALAEVLSATEGAGTADSAVAPQPLAVSPAPREAPP